MNQCFSNFLFSKFVSFGQNSFTWFTASRANFCQIWWIEIYQGSFHQYSASRIPAAQRWQLDQLVGQKFNISYKLPDLKRMTWWHWSQQLDNLNGSKSSFRPDLVRKILIFMKLPYRFSNTYLITIMISSVHNPSV